MCIKMALKNQSFLHSCGGARLNLRTFCRHWANMFFIVYFLLVISYFSMAQHDSLRLVHLVFRHGQRTPASTYPNDPHINETFAPYGWGQLTNEGKICQYQQGKWLRERYGNFLGEYHPDMTKAMTTDVDRTKASSQYMMAGLFPPNGTNIWNKDLLWQSVPSSYQPLSEDKLLIVRGCPRYSEALEEALMDERIQNRIQSYDSLYKYLTLNTGMEVKDPWDVEDVYSTLKAEEDLNLMLPNWTDSVYPEIMKEATAYSYILNACNNELKKIKGGSLLKKILNDSKDKSEGKTPKIKLYSYAGHDFTVSNLLLAMNVWTEQIPVYNILVMIELHEIDGEYALKIFLRNSMTKEPHELIIPGCQSPCKLSIAFETFAQVLPGDMKKLCALKNPDFKPKEESGT